MDARMAECGLDEMLALWEQGQRTFWSAMAGLPSDGGATAASPPAWEAFDGFWAALAGALPAAAPGAEWRGLSVAAARYRGVILDTWRRVHAGFDVQRRAMCGPGLPPPDWREVRARWLAIAEAEFVRTLGSADFLDAQREALRAVVAWRAALPEVAALDALSDAGRTAGRAAIDTALAGIDIATTPKDEVWRRGRISVCRYRPLGPTPRLGPVLICHGRIGRQTMTDLRPDRSLVRNLLAAGVDVLVLDWGDAGREEGADTFAGCEARLGQAIAGALAACGRERLVLFGICQGGTIAACHAARRPETLSGLILAVTPVDFHADREDADPAHGLLNVWVRSLGVRDLRALIAVEDGLSGDLMGTIFSQLNPVRTLAKYAVEMPEAARDPSALATFLAMEKWLADRPDMPGPLARTWLIDLYRRNALAEGRFRPGGRPVDLRAIGVPVLNVYASGDHIIPPPSSRALGRLADRRLYRELALPTGHVGIFVSARSQALLAPAVVGWLAELPAAGGSRRCERR